MADVKPLRALRYDPQTVGSLDAVVAPPYDVIDGPMRARLAARSPFNVVEVDLPEGSDPYLKAQTTFEAWLQEGVVVREREPTLWAMTQDYTGPDGRSYTRHGFFCRVRVEDYGPGRIRPHERTQPGPKEDRLRLTRATRTNLSPIFSLFADIGDEAWSALEPATREAAYAAVTDEDGTVSTIWRVVDQPVIQRVEAILSEQELLIADGHHRYETARVYAGEIGGEGEHSYVLMFLCSLSDSGLTIFPTHRLLSGLSDEQRERLNEAIERDFEAEPVDRAELAASTGSGVVFGYLDRDRVLRLRLRDDRIVERLMADRPAAYRRLDTAVLEEIVLKGALGMTEDDIAAKRGVSYSKSFEDAVAAVDEGRAEVAFFMRATPVELVQEIAETGESMPPKSTYFYPKIPTGLIFNELD